MNPLVLLQLFAGLALLIVGAEVLIKSSVKLGKAVGLSSLVIGMTVVAFGTSAPEIAVSIQATLGGQPDVALGNIVGSNIFNVLFILGASSIIRVMSVKARLIWVDTLVMIGVAVLFYLFCMDRRLNALEGIALLSGLIIYTIFTIQMSRKESRAIQKEYGEGMSNGSAVHKGSGFLILQIFAVLAGLGILVMGSRWFVDASILIAKSMGVSDLVISLTIVAAGTSLPEVATSVIAAIKGEKDIAVGNVVGSNIFNILGIGGLCGILSGHGVSVAPSLLQFDIPVMIAVSLACLPIFFSGHRINRAEGVIFLGYYILYTAYLLLKSSEHDALPLLSATLGYFVIPLTGITLIFIALQQVRRGRSA